ncbi:hypothetical protein NECAME_04241 [Necator americanus]|uniref:Uncharacterized protein n=1 Tax=Necator americanus TaxID=51031 RepID=W2SWH3_NECAM|nr:hypothetical protein NECAME_04241 [Necator americanus]ETN73848.1 hypothetical protein NECAME_04241 [Necator americanus]
MTENCTKKNGVSVCVCVTQCDAATAMKRISAMRPIATYYLTFKESQSCDETRPRQTRTDP